MSRLSRALGFPDGDKSARPSAADSPKVRRIRETMRWRGYDLSEYTDEQIEAVSARFPNDISEDGETTEDGRRALAAALEQGDFAPPAGAEAPAAEAPPTPGTPPEAPAAPQAPREPARPASASASAYRRALGMPTLPERVAHVFGIHAWRPLDGEGGTRAQCVGCGQMRNDPIPFRPPPPPPSPPPPPREDPASRREPPPSPLDDLSNFERRDRDRDRMGAPPQRPQRPPGQERPDSVWDFFMGLPWWSKLLAIFIAIQVVLFIVSAIAGGGGGG